MKKKRNFIVKADDVKFLVTVKRYVQEHYETKQFIEKFFGANVT